MTPEDALENNLERWSGMKMIQINIILGRKILLTPLSQIQLHLICEKSTFRNIMIFSVFWSDVTVG